MLPTPIDRSPEASALRPLFVYGRLADASFLRQLLEREVASRSARLDGFGLWDLDGLEVAIRSEGASVDGLLLEGLSAEDYRRVDAYRGVAEGLFRRLELAVEAADGSRTAFVFLPSARTLATRR